MGRDGGLLVGFRMKKPDADDLIPYMPDCVREEYLLSGAGLLGLTPMVEHWITTSTLPAVEKWHDNLLRYVYAQYREAERRQKVMNAAAPEYYGKQNGQVRNRGVIDPVIMAHNRKCFENPEAIRDTQSKEPKLFIK